METECKHIFESQQTCPLKVIKTGQPLVRQCAGNDFDLVCFEQLETLSGATVLKQNQFEQLSTDVSEPSVNFSQLKNDDTTVLGITKINSYIPGSSNNKYIMSILVNYNNKDKNF